MSVKITCPDCAGECEDDCLGHFMPIAHRGFSVDSGVGAE